MKNLLFRPGQTIFTQGDASDLTYRILAGSVDIVINGPDGPKKIASLGPDEIFGEMGIIDDSPRSATAVAREQTACQAYTPDQVLELLANNPNEAIDLIRTLILRLRRATKKITTKPNGPI